MEVLTLTTFAIFLALVFKLIGFVLMTLLTIKTVILIILFIWGYTTVLRGEK